MARLCTQPACEIPKNHRERTHSQLSQTCFLLHFAELLHSQMISSEPDVAFPHTPHSHLHATLKLMPMQYEQHSSERCKDPLDRWVVVIVRLSTRERGLKSKLVRAACLYGSSIDR